MPLDLRITRRRHWLDPSDDDISEKEWRELVEIDPALHWLGAADGRDHRGEAIHVDAPNLAAWDHPQAAEAWFDFAEGSVVVADPDPPTVDKCRQLAKLLGARLQDGDGAEWK